MFRLSGAEKENMARLNRRLRALLIVATTVLVTVALIEATLPHLGFFWHLVNNPKASIDGYSFIVPPKYFLSHSEEELTMVRLSPLMPLISRRSDVAGPFAKRNLIGIYKHPGGKSFDKEADYVRLRDWLIVEAKRGGLRLEIERSLSTQIGTTYCFQFNSSDLTGIRCFFEGSNVTVLFDGEPRFANDVYMVVSSAGRTS